MLAALATFVAAALVVILIPGPDTLVLLRSMVRSGRRGGLATAAGILGGLAIWVCVACLGLAAVLRASEAAYAVLRVIGACYLVVLGVRSLRSLRRTAPAVEDAPSRGLLGTGFVAGLATNLMNPKVGVFFVTFLPGFVPGGWSVAAGSLIFGAVFIGLSVLYFALLIAVAGRIGRWLARPRVRKRLDVITGVVLVGFGVRLAVES